MHVALRTFGPPDRHRTCLVRFRVTNRTLTTDAVIILFVVFKVFTISIELHSIRISSTNCLGTVAVRTLRVVALQRGSQFLEIGDAATHGAELCSHRFLERNGFLTRLKRKISSSK